MIKQSDKADVKLVVQSGHKKAVNSVVFAPDGSFFVTGSNDKTVKIWDSASCLCKRTLHGHSDLVLTAVVSPDGKLIASGGKDRNLIIWDALTGEKIAESYQWSFHSLLFSPDNKYILAASDETTEITVFEAPSGKLTASFDTGDGIPAISFSPDGKTFVSGSHNSVLTFWEFPDGKIKKSIKTNCGRITAASYSPDGSNVIYANEKGEISICRVETGECSKIIKTKGQVIYSVLYSSDGRFIIAADKKKNITFWDTSSYKQVKKLTGHTGAVFSVCLSPDGKYLLSGSTDASVIKWDSETGDILKTIDSNTFKLSFKALSHDGYKAASLNYDSKKHNSEVKIWDIRTCKCIRTFNFKQHQIFDIVFATDSKTVLMGDLSFETASKGYSVSLWDIETGSKIMDFCEDDSFENMVVTPDGKQIFEAVRVYENNTPELKINIRDQCCPKKQ
ncbi:MAG: WD40 repeat domain-containing protein [Firmicutes bacterium]|nr:WD40 repeat domain-containing protein [Bacillota bacterium]